MRKKEKSQKGTHYEELMSSPDFARGVENEYIKIVVAARLAAVRKAAKLSQAKLAQRLKTPKSAISRLESGRVGVTMMKVHEFARGCGREFVYDFPVAKKKVVSVAAKKVVKKKVAR